MRSSKERKHERKRAQKEKNIRKTDISRARRINNKAKRNEIHSINPNLEITIVNNKTFVKNREVSVENGMIVMKDAVLESFEDSVENLESKIVKVSNEIIKKSAFERLTNKLRRNE